MCMLVRGPVRGACAIQGTEGQPRLIPCPSLSARASYGQTVGICLVHPALAHRLPAALGVCPIPLPCTPAQAEVSPAGQTISPAHSWLPSSASSLLCPWTRDISGGINASFGPKSMGCGMGTGRLHSVLSWLLSPSSLWKSFLSASEKHCRGVKAPFVSSRALGCA